MCPGLFCLLQIRVFEQLYLYNVPLAQIPFPFLQISCKKPININIYIYLSTRELLHICQ